MASQGPLTPGTVADDASVGSATWTTTGTIGTFSDASGPTPGSITGVGGTTAIESSIKLVKGGTISGNNKSTGASLPVGSGSETIISYGGSADIWGLTLTDTDINASTFGVALSYVGDGSGPATSHYLKLTNFGFSIPAGATINGVLVEVQGYASGSMSFIGPTIDGVRITVTYTAGASGVVSQSRFGRQAVQSASL